ncbi:MAG: ComEC family competence protein [Planctomycetales bacterium]|nr:ComEC family competence protein [bacterium]UNM07470.1 MAG: ComEC family competence protein [Planctomycetales bacterium]
MFGFLKERVYLQVLLLFSTGIALGGNFRMPHGLPADVMIPGLVLLCSLLMLHFIWRDSDIAWARLPAAIAIGMCGYLYCNIAIQQVTLAPLLNHANSDSRDAEAVVRSLPKYQRGHLRFIAEVYSVGEVRREAGLGRCQFYLQCEPDLLLSPGDHFEFTGELEEVANPRNRGQFNYRAYLLQRGTVMTCYLPSPGFMEVLDDSGSRRLAWLTRLRGRLTESLTRSLPAGLQDLAVSVVYGDKITDLDDGLQERFRRAGLTHILVASGTQVSLLIVLMAMILWRSPRSFDTRGTLVSLAQFLVTIGVVAVYAGITGYETSIVRALCMGILLCAGRLFLRRVDGLSTLSQAGLILLLGQPLQLFTPGFQLSFLATFGLIYMMGTLNPLVTHLGGWRRFLLDGLLTTGGAQLFVTPVLAASFNQFSLVGLFSNLLAVPLSLALLVCGALSSFGLSALPGVGTVLSWIVTILCRLLDGLATFFAGLPFSSIAVPSPPAWAIVTFYALVLLAGEWYRNREELSVRQLMLLQPACLLLGWIVIGWIAMRSILPHPQLAVLRMDRSFAVYYDNPASGRTLLVDPYWLSRRHNADNLVSSLKARGISSLDRVLWLADVPEENPLLELSPVQQELAKADDLPFELVGGGKSAPTGMLCGLGRGTVSLSWDPSAQPAVLADLHVLVIPRDMPYEPESWSNNSYLWVSVDSLPQPGGSDQGVLRISDAEISIKPAPQDRLSSFTLKRR